MKFLNWIQILGLFLLFEISALAITPEDRKDLFLDLDGTLIHKIEDFLLLAGTSWWTVQPIRPVDTVTSERSVYQLAFGLREVLGTLSHVKGLRLSYFSAGEEDRNREVLRQIEVQERVTALDLSGSTEDPNFSFRLFSRTTVRRGLKDLNILARYEKSFYLPNSVLWDDKSRVAYPGQSQNLLKTHGVLQFEGGAYEDYFDGTALDFASSEHLVYSTGLYLLALRISVDRKLDIASGLDQLQRTIEMRSNLPEELQHEYNLAHSCGTVAIRQFYPAFDPGKVISARTSIYCRKQLNGLFD